MQGVGSEFEETSKPSGRSGGPEREFLHERSLLMGDEGFQFAIERWEIRV